MKELIEFLIQIKALDQANELRSGNTVLDLTGCRFSNKQIFLLTNILKTTTEITKLNLTSNQIGKKGLMFVSKLLEANNPHLLKLDLSCNDINHNGLKLIAKALKYNSNLTTLNLQCNKLTDIEMLAEALKTNRTLTKLDLSNNIITDSEIVPFINVLSFNTTLKQLKLGYNYISKEGGVKIAEVLKTNNTIIELSLWRKEGNNTIILTSDIGYKEMEAMRTYLERNTNLSKNNQENLMLNAQFGNFYGDMKNDKKIIQCDDSNKGDELIALSGSNVVDMHEYFIE